jgi:hypothetical protein
VKTGESDDRTVVLKEKSACDSGYPETAPHPRNHALSDHRLQPIPIKPRYSSWAASGHGIPIDTASVICARYNAD